MKTVKKPDTWSAATTARTISRRMRKAGFVMADTSDRFNWTEGWYVRRLGVSSSVTVDYNASWKIEHDHKVFLEKRASILADKVKMRAFLTAAGYDLLPDRLEVKCLHE